MELAAKIVSYIFHPLLMPCFGLFIIFNSNSYVNYLVPSEVKHYVLLLVGSSTFVIPLLISLLLVNKGQINSLEMESPRERIIPYAFTIVFYIITLVIIKNYPIPPIIHRFIIGATLSVILAFLINFKWKISAHMIGAGGLVGALSFMAIALEVNMLTSISLTLLLAGMIGVARLILKAHQPAQVYAGFALGVFCQVIAIGV